MKYLKEIDRQRLGYAIRETVKNLQTIHRIIVDVPEHKSSMIVSHMTFVFPYGLSALSRVVSGIGISGGVPYTVADEE